MPVPKHMMPKTRKQMKKMVEKSRAKAVKRLYTGSMTAPKGKTK